MFSAFSTADEFGHESVELPSVLGYPLELAGFWTAVLLPFVLLGLVVVGIAQQSPWLLTGLVSANVAGLVLGKDHRR